MGTVQLNLQKSDDLLDRIHQYNIDRGYIVGYRDIELVLEAIWNQGGDVVWANEQVAERSQPTNATAKKEPLHVNARIRKRVDL